MRILYFLLSFVALGSLGSWAATVTIDDSPTGQRQTIDGFGTCIGKWGTQDWFQNDYYDDMGCSIMRMDLVPHFVSPYSDNSYNSPWFTNKPPFGLDADGGPEHNWVRTYTGPDDYTRPFGPDQAKAQIAIMGPDIDQNIKLLSFQDHGPGGVLQDSSPGAVAKAGLARKDKLGDFKLYGSVWSPAPWLKIANGQKFGDHTHVMPATGTPYPFIWGGNFGGGSLDTSDKPLDVFNDGTGPTSALTQFARCLAATIKGFQDTYGVHFYGISIQNELNFPEYYNSCVYFKSADYIAAIKAVRKEFDSHPDTKDVRIIGPEDLLGGTPYAMWQIGGGGFITHKNLQILKAVSEDPEADAALSFFCIHGYAGDGGTAIGADSVPWRWWSEGWKESPGAGIPDNIPGFTSYKKKSWMTETSGEQPEWLSPATGFPKNGGWSIALKMQQALTVGQESALIYWQFAEPTKADGKTTTSCYTREQNPTQEPKYVAAKHFIKYIRPGAIACQTTVADDNGVTASAFMHPTNHTLTIVLVNKSADSQPTTVKLPDDFANVKTLHVVTSSDGSYWQETDPAVNSGSIDLTAPGYSVITLVAQQ